MQSDKLDSHRLRQAFTIMLLLNGSLALLPLGIAPIAADYYDQPMVADLLRVQALLYLSTPFISIPEAIMGRALDFKRPALVNLIAAIASAAVALVGALEPLIGAIGVEAMREANYSVDRDEDKLSFGEAARRLAERIGG